MQRVKSLLILVVVAAFASTAWAMARVYFEQPPNLYYAGQNGLTSTPVVSQAIYGADVYSNAVLNEIGGVLFQAAAEPAESVKQNQILLRYDKSKADGSRLTVQIGDDILAPRIFDWELVPIVNFVKSGNTAVITLLDKPRNASERLFELKKQSQGEQVFFTAVHPALKDTLIGLNSVFVDAMFIGPPASAADLLKRANSFSNIRFKSSEDAASSERVPGYNDITPQSEVSQATAQSILDIIKVASSHGGGYILTDVNSRFVFSPSRKTLSITGSPEYYFWHPDANGDLKNTSVEFKYETLIRFNRAIFGSLRKFARYAAFFRYVRRVDNAEFEKLSASINESDISQFSLSTPRAFGHQSAGAR